MIDPYKSMKRHQPSLIQHFESMLILMRKVASVRGARNSPMLHNCDDDADDDQDSDLDGLSIH